MRNAQSDRQRIFPRAKSITNIPDMLFSFKTIMISRQTAFDVFLRWLTPIGLGVFFSLLVVKGAWYYAIAMVLAAPVVIALIARPFIGIILWLLLMPFISLLPRSELMYWLFHRILILLVLILTIIIRRQSKGAALSVQLRPPDIAALILAGFGPILIAAFQANVYFPLIHYVDRFLIPIFIYLTVRLNPLDEQDLKLLQWTVLLIAISQGMIGIMSMLTPGLLPHALRSYRQGYADGTLDNPNVFAIVLLFCAVLLFQSAMRRKPSWSRSGFLVACGLCAIGVFFSMERAAWLAGAFVLLGLLWLYPKPIFRLLLVGGIALVVLFQAGFLSKYIDSASNRFDHQQPIFDRIVVTDAMVQMALMKPIFGWGYETLNENITQYYRQLGNARIVHGLVTSHNTYLTIATELGLITLLLFIFPPVWLMAKTIRGHFKTSSESPWDASMLTILWLAAISYLIISNFLDMRFFPFGIGLWWLTLGLIANVVDPMVVGARFAAGSWNHEPDSDMPQLQRRLQPDRQS